MCGDRYTDSFSNWRWSAARNATASVVRIAEKPACSAPNNSTPATDGSDINNAATTATQSTQAR